ncbi:MAG: hypothetical protein IOD12_09830 [Silvanigrellales bacterium]|nr:hypothetical protein [Silvanigrellales bacterium]
MEHAEPPSSKVSSLRVGLCVFMLVGAEALAFKSNTFAWVVAGTAFFFALSLAHRAYVSRSPSTTFSIARTPFSMAALFAFVLACGASFADALTRAFPSLVEGARLAPMPREPGSVSAKRFVATWALQGDAAFAKAKWRPEAVPPAAPVLLPGAEAQAETLALPFIRMGSAVVQAMRSGNSAEARTTLQLFVPGVAPRVVVSDVSLQMVRARASKDTLSLAWWRRTPAQLWALESARVQMKADQIRPETLESDKRTLEGRAAPLGIQTLGAARESPLGIVFSSQNGTLVRARPAPLQVGMPLILDVLQGKAPSSDVLDAMETLLGASQTQPVKNVDDGVRAWNLEGNTPVAAAPPRGLADSWLASPCDAVKALTLEPLCEGERLSPSGARVARLTPEGVAVSELGGRLLGLFPLPGRLAGKPLAIVAFPTESQVLLAPSFVSLAEPLVSLREQSKSNDPWAAGPLTASARALLQRGTYRP